MIAVIFFLSSNILLLFKLIFLVFIKLCLITFLPKISLILLLIFIIAMFYKYPKKRFKTLSELRKYKQKRLFKYAMRTKIQKIYNIFILTFFVSLFFIGLAFLRFTNNNNTLDLLEKKKVIYNLYLNTPLFDFALTCFLFILLFIVYFFILISLTNYVKFHAIKCHLYLVGNENTKDIDNWYQLKLFRNIINKINFYTLHYKLCFDIIPTAFENVYVFFNKNTVFTSESPAYNFWFSYKNKINIILLHLLTKWHYVLLVILLLHDCYFNNYNIHLIFIILPWTFLYDVYLRTSKFFDGFHLAYDTYINTVLYATTIEIITEEDWLIDGEFYNLKNFKHIYATYVCKDFVKNVHTLCL